MEEILEAARKVADAADLFWVESRSTPVAFETNRLKHMQTKEARGVGLRIIKDGRIGFSATNKVEDVDGIVSRAAEVAPYGAKAEFALPSATNHPDVPTFDPEVPQVSIEKMVELSQEMVEGILEGHPDVLCDSGSLAVGGEGEDNEQRGGGCLLRKDGVLDWAERYAGEGHGHAVCRGGGKLVQAD